jgi:catechol 2,3-dioxygenase-like lactoylglutathione lyase family enzyme
MELADQRVRAVLPVIDFERATAFYGERLGLPLVEEPAPGEAVYRCGQGTQLAL